MTAQDRCDGSSTLPWGTTSPVTRVDSLQWPQSPCRVGLLPSLGSRTAWLWQTRVHETDSCLGSLMYRYHGLWLWWSSLYHGQPLSCQVATTVCLPLCLRSLNRVLHLVGHSRQSQGGAQARDMVFHSSCRGHLLDEYLLGCTKCSSGGKLLPSSCMRSLAYSSLPSAYCNAACSAVGLAACRDTRSQQHTIATGGSHNHWQTLPKQRPVSGCSSVRQANMPCNWNVSGMLPIPEAKTSFFCRSWRAKKSLIAVDAPLLNVGLQSGCWENSHTWAR